MAAGLGITALVVSIISIGVAVWGVQHAKRSADAAVASAQAAERSATASEAVDQRARTPQLTILLDHPGLGDRMIYRVRNDGPQDLNAVVVHRPQPPGGIVYDIARTGRNTGWAQEADLGPLAMAQEGTFTLSCGIAQDLPEFQVRIESRAGTDTWDTIHVLPPPRGSADKGIPTGPSFFEPVGQPPTSS